MSPVDSLTRPLRSASRLACVPLPAPGGPISSTISEALPGGVWVVPPRRVVSRSLTLEAPSATADAALVHEAFVVTHHQLRFELTQRVERDPDHDEQARSGEHERQLGGAGDPGEYLRQCVDEAEEQRAPQRDAGGDLGEVVGGRLSRAHAWNELAVLPEVLADPSRIE